MAGNAGANVKPDGYGALAIFLLTMAAAATAHADPKGMWLATDGSKIRISSCGGALCGTVAVPSPRIDPDTGEPPLDKNNEDPSKRNRPLAGLQILISMRPNGDGTWSGKLYDSDGGKFYSGNIIERDHTTIRIEGCWLGLCGGEDLTRAE
jgi:uncharacterized protein (DUF2147 family)